MHGRLHSFAARVLLACLPVVGLVMVAGAGSASAARTPVNTRAAALTALKHLLNGAHGTDHAVLGHLSVTGAPTKVKSTNWSGYADTGSTFSKIGGSWVEPSVKCTSTEALAAFWVGIDGYSSQTVEQDGTLAFCDGGSAAYYTWWEMYPSNDIQIVGQTVKPGDKIVATVVKTGTKYALKVTDSTTKGNNVSTTQTCAAATCKDSSAEWIAEAPTSSGSVVPLPDFGTWTLTGASVTGGGKAGTISSFTDDEITMVSGSGKTEASPGALSNGGKQFKVTWKST
jgi:hypothetical protein